MKKLSDLMKRQLVMFNESNEQLPSTKELPDGIYKALVYAWVFELKDGRKYNPGFGLKRGRKMAKWEMYEVKNGVVGMTKL